VAGLWGNANEPLVTVKDRAFPNWLKCSYILKQDSVPSSWLKYNVVCESWDIWILIKYFSSFYINPQSVIDRNEKESTNNIKIILIYGRTPRISVFLSFYVILPDLRGPSYKDSQPGCWQNRKWFSTDYGGYVWIMMYWTTMVYQKFPDWPPAAITANDTALCH
jgi:hypothetical protein